MRETDWYRGALYAKMQPDEVIFEGCIQRWQKWEFHPVKPESIGQTPADFSPHRSFFKPAHLVTRK